MINYAFQELSQFRYGRKILQTNTSSSSFDTSQPSFVALLCLISILIVLFLIIIIIVCYRYCFRPRHKVEDQNTDGNNAQQNSSIPNNPQSIIPVSVADTYGSAYSVRSHENFIFYHRLNDQNSFVDRSPSHHLQYSILDSYLNDINSFQALHIDPEQFKSYLFIDLHSTSSETFPDSNSNVISNSIDSYKNIECVDNKNQGRRNYYIKRQQRKHRSTLNSKQSRGARFVMRERYLPNNHQRLPQLRSLNTKQESSLFTIDEAIGNDTTITNQILPSIDMTNATDDYDDSHAYHVNQNQIIRKISSEEKLSLMQQYIPYSFTSPSHIHRNQKS